MEEFTSEWQHIFDEEFFDQEIGYPVQEEVAVPAQKPLMYQVALMNDDFTPMDFVVEVLRTLFHKNERESVEIMWRTHREGQAVCGVYTRDVAETKMAHVITLARKYNYPLKCVVRKDNGDE